MVKNTSLVVASPTGTLQRGKACLRCRKRKMRCDGAKPSCQQCLRAKKPEGCEYDDGRGKTRTQILRETIARLEQRIRELEDPEFTSPSVTLFDPHSHQRSGSTTSSTDGSQASAPVFTPDLSHSPQIWSLNGDPSPASTPLGDGFHLNDPLLPLDVAPMLLDIFASHRHQCGLEIHMGRLRESLTGPVAQQRHPVLMNAIFLWSCYLSRPGHLSQHETHYLSRVLDSLPNALQFSSRILDAIQASCLLATYFLSNGRLLEGSYHATAASSLAVQCGLYRSTSNDSSRSLDTLDPLKLNQPKDMIEDGERMSTFWQVFILDRCWSVVLRKPPIIPDDCDALTAIKSPWPQGVEELQLRQFEDNRNLQGTRSFLESPGPNSAGGISIQVLRAKASTLFERANRLSVCWDPRMPSVNAYRDNVQALERSISRFIPTLIPVHQLDATMPHDKHALIIIHSLANTAMIHLCYRFSQDDTVSYEKSLRAARACVVIIKHITDTDFEFLDPIIGPCWTCAAEVLIQELRKREASWPLLDCREVRNELGTVMFAMNALGTRFPLLNFSYAKLQKRLAEP